MYGTVLQEMIYKAVRLIRRGRRYWLRFGKGIRVMRHCRAATGNSTAPEPLFLTGFVSHAVSSDKSPFCLKFVKIPYSGTRLLPNTDFMPESAIIRRAFTTLWR